MKVIRESSNDKRYWYYYATDDDAFQYSGDKRELLGISTRGGSWDTGRFAPSHEAVTFYHSYFLSGEYMPQIVVAEERVLTVFERAAEWYRAEKIAYITAQDSLSYIDEIGKPV